MTGRRADATAATRRAVVAAARDLLAERRWQQFTVDAVARRAGVTRVTVYNQVGSKSGMLDAVLTDLTARSRMDRLLTDTEHLAPAEACTAIVRRTCAFWHAERDVLRPVFGLAAVDLDVAAALEQRERWRGDQLDTLLRRLTGALPPDDVRAGVVAVTSFPAYDALGAVAGDPERAAGLVDRLVRALVADVAPAAVDG